MLSRVSCVIKSKLCYQEYVVLSSVSCVIKSKLCNQV